MPFVVDDEIGGRIVPTYLTPPQRAKKKRGRIEPPDTMGLRVIFGPIEGVTYGSAFKDGDAFVFQCPPLDEFQENHNFNHSDYDTAFAGQRSRPGGRQLIEIQFNTLWLDDGSKNHAPGWAVVKQAMDPLEAKQRLIRLGRSMRPFWVMAHQMPMWHRYDLRLQMTMRSLSSLEKHGEEDSRYFSISLKEFRDSSVQSRSNGKAGPIDRVGPGGTTLSVAFLTGDEETLYEIATKYYGSSGMWKSIKSANPVLSEIGPSDNLKTKFAPLGSFSAARAVATKIWLPPRVATPKPQPKIPGQGGRAYIGG